MRYFETQPIEKAEVMLSIAKIIVKKRLLAPVESAQKTYLPTPKKTKKNHHDKSTINDVPLLGGPPTQSQWPGALNANLQMPDPFLHPPSYYGYGAMPNPGVMTPVDMAKVKMESIEHASMLAEKLNAMAENQKPKDKEQKKASTKAIETENSPF